MPGNASQFSIFTSPAQLATQSSASSANNTTSSNSNNHSSNSAQNHRRAPSDSGPRPWQESSSGATVEAKKKRTFSLSSSSLSQDLAPPQQPPQPTTPISAAAAAAVTAADDDDDDDGKQRSTATPTSAKRKRDPHQPAPAAASEPASKRLRLKPRLSKYELDSFSLGSIPAFSAADLDDQNLLPPSPLFFSHTRYNRPQLPPRFSSSEAGARMLSKARGEDNHVKTVSLARGTITTPTSSPAAAIINTSAIRRSLERSSTGRSHSPESQNGRDIIGNNAAAHLSSIGVTELLEQDDRPTFIVDLSDHSNYGPGPMHPLFTNLSLRAIDGLSDYIAGTASGEQSPDATTFIQFKSWVLSAAVNGESLNVCLPPFTYAGMSWSCSTLRRRLRIISGTFPQAAAVAAPLLPPATAATTSSRPVPSTRAPASTGSIPSAPPSAPAIAPSKEPAYYFAPALTPPKTAVSSDVKPSIESELSSNASNSGQISSRAQASSPLARDLLATSTDTPRVPSSGNSVQISPDIKGYLQRTADATVDEVPSFDWTLLPPDTLDLPPHIAFARSVDWAATPLGPIELWSQDLRNASNLIMASPHPAAMYWGPELVAIYNEAYVMLAGQKHPTLMGQPYQEAWPEIWHAVEDVFANARSTGEATMKDDDCLFILRNNYLEETYFSWSIIPMLGDDGSVAGLYNPAFEKTRRKIAERRMLTLREVGERTASARDIKAFWSQVLDSFDFNEYDSPFVLLYSVGDESDSDSSSVHSSSVQGPRMCMLEGALGVPQGHPAAPEQIEMRAGQEGFMPAFREVMKTDKPMLLEVGSRELPEHLLEGLQMRGFGDPVRAVVVTPVHPTTGESVLGFLVLGINPRRPYDDDYSLFVQLLSRQLATSLASVVLFEEEIRRGQRAARLAALDRIELSEQLAARTKEAMEYQGRFSKMAEFAPVGMFIAASDGLITFANDGWYEISKLTRDGKHTDKWIDCVKEEDRPIVEQMWRDLESGTKNVSKEIRFKSQWDDRNGNRSDTWVLFSAYAEKHDDGQLKSVFGSITNISQQKWAEGLQTRKMEEAIELKRQQENFIDITSHEMRNPLSAILQCADEITDSLKKVKGDEATAKFKGLSDVLESCLESAQTISLCSQHQKRIVDDVLTLSKLDSQLLLVTPVDAQPLTVVQRALKMHEGELSAADIKMRFVVDKSFKDLELDWMRFDPSRVMQVLINLTSNALKFTSQESRRTITVTVSASRQKLSECSDTPVRYFPSRNKYRDLLSESEWGDGEKVFVQFAVQDTGRGLTPDEKKLLFQRFSQASPRTHVQYGGSGLGLFISRELTELQGGEIGVASESGKGSTFAFYIAARKSKAPKDNDPAAAMMRGFVAGTAAAKKEENGNATLQNGSVKTTASAATAVPEGARRRVLIVEDNLVNQKVLQKQLKNKGLEVHLANHGGEAIEKLKQSTYWADNTSEHKVQLGVVLMDQEMPVMDGLTCTRKIRELEKEGKLTCHVPIIAVTANARVEQIQTALDAGMDSVQPKPFTVGDLLPKIEVLYEQHLKE